MSKPEARPLQGVVARRNGSPASAAKSGVPRAPLPAVAERLTEIAEDKLVPCLLAVGFADFCLDYVAIGALNWSLIIVIWAVVDCCKQEASLPAGNR